METIKEILMFTGMFAVLALFCLIVWYVYDWAIEKLIFTMRNHFYYKDPNKPKIVNLEGFLMDLESRVNSLKLMHNEKSDVFIDKFHKVENEVKSNSIQIAGMDRKLNTFINDLGSKLTDNSNELSRTDERVSKIIADLGKESHKNPTLEKRLFELEKWATDMTTAHNENDKEIKALKLTMLEQATSIDGLTGRHENLVASVGEMKEALKEWASGKSFKLNV